MRIFMTRAFYQWAKKEQLADTSLLEAVFAIEQGHYEVNLGGNLYKKRIGVAGRGKSGGLRTILAFKGEDKVFFFMALQKIKGRIPHCVKFLYIKN
jgi:hypothetical protein